jgi:glycerol uptake facilitator-like aquaporin
MFGACMVEFLGTALLVSGGAFGGGLMAVAALAIAIALGGRVSGGHFNPAVTFFRYMSGELSQTKAMYYVTSQYCASILVYFLYNL